MIISPVNYHLRIVNRTREVRYMQEKGRHEVHLEVAGRSWRVIRDRNGPQQDAEVLQSDKVLCIIAHTQVCVLRKQAQWRHRALR